MKRFMYLLTIFSMMMLFLTVNAVQADEDYSICSPNITNVTYDPITEVDIMLQITVSFDEDCPHIIEASLEDYPSWGLHGIEVTVTRHTYFPVGVLTASDQLHNETMLFLDILPSGEYVMTFDVSDTFVQRYYTYTVAVTTTLLEWLGASISQLLDPIQTLTWIHGDQPVTLNIDYDADDFAIETRQDSNSLIEPEQPPVRRNTP